MNMMEAIISISMLILSTLILTGLVTIMMLSNETDGAEVSVLGEEVDEERKETPKEKTKKVKEEVKFIPTTEDAKNLYGEKKQKISKKLHKYRR